MNQDYFGFSGSSFFKATGKYYFYKPMSWDNKKAAVLLINTDTASEDLAFSFSDVPGLVGNVCDVRDIWARKDLGSATGSYTVSQVSQHDSAFLMLTCS